MSGLDRLPERMLQVELKRQVADSAELKGSFQALGSTSVLTHRIFSAAPYDVQINPGSAPNVPKFHRVDVEYVPDDETFGGAFCLDLKVKARNLSGGRVDRWAIEVERKPVVDGAQRWSVYYITYGFPEDAVRLKFYLFALGSGTFTVNVVN